MNKKTNRNCIKVIILSHLEGVLKIWSPKMRWQIHCGVKDMLRILGQISDIENLTL